MAAPVRGILGRAVRGLNAWGVGRVARQGE